MSTLWQVTLVSPPYSELTYGLPAHFPALVPGQRVVVPLGRSYRMGVIVAPTVDPPKGVDIKPMIWPLEHEPLLGADYLDMARNLAARQMLPMGRILEAFLPKGVRSAAVTFQLGGHMSGADLPVSAKPGALVRMSDRQLQALVELWEQGRMRVRIDPKKEAEERFVTLVSDPPWPVRPNAVRQLLLLNHLADNGPQSLHFLDHSLGDWIKDVVRKLEKTGLVSVETLTGENLDLVDGGVREPAGAETPFRLTPEQETAYQEMRRLMESDRFGQYLLFGITGSGKTAVYLELAGTCLDMGRPAMLLAPEVALASQLHREAVRRFPDRKVILYHGYQSPRKREAVFRSLAQPGEPVLVVGTRSALFLPLPNLGLVVADEEHDESYKQEDRVPYQAKEIAWFRLRSSGGLLVLGSATPDIKTFHASRQGRIPLAVLRERVGGGCLPQVEMVDISGLTDPDQPFAKQTLEALCTVVERGEQAMVMLNRRGYAPLMYCMDCGETVRCPECEVGMTFHKGRERLVCHYCGLTYSYPLLCAKCGGGNFLPMGEGTERLEEVLRDHLPKGTAVARLDRDATRKQERMDEILEGFAAGRSQVLVGTQMISKGHHFPMVTLVVVADGDLGLSLPDYRSSERAFQLLVQVAGRAGRGECPGRVLIQTRNKAHPIWEEVLAGAYESFFDREIGRRERFGYPPFVRLGLIRISYPVDWEGGVEAMSALAKALRDAAGRKGVRVLGPAPAPLGRIRGRKRFHCMLKGEDWLAIREVFGEMAGANPAPRHIRLALDLDPVSML